MIDHLIEIIGREARLFESFLESLEAQQRMLVNNDVDGLNQVTSFQREKLVESQLLDREREQLVEKIKEINQIDGDLTVSRLLTLVDESKANQLMQLRGAIMELNDKIEQVRNQNALLLNRSREYIGRTMDMLSKMANNEAVYSSSGSATGRKDAIAFSMDRRA